MKEETLNPAVESDVPEEIDVETLSRLVAGEDVADTCDIKASTFW